MKFKVRVTEHERGWGQRYEDEIFDDYEKAHERMKSVNDRNTEQKVPDIYWTAGMPHPIE